MPRRWVDAASWWPPPRRSTARTPPARWSRIPTASWAHRSWRAGRYSEAKAVDEILAHAYWKERGTEAIVVRFFNCVGPRQTGAYGMVIPSLVRQALRGEDVTVYGSGEQRRCFCHVQDTVAAVVSLLDHPDSPGDPFNIGALNEVTINELAARIIERTGDGVEGAPHPLRGRLRRGLRGHGTPGSRHHARSRPHRLGAHAYARRHPGRCHRLRAGADLGQLTGSALRPVLNSARGWVRASKLPTRQRRRWRRLRRAPMGPPRTRCRPGPAPCRPRPPPGDVPAPSS